MRSLAVQGFAAPLMSTRSYISRLVFTQYALLPFLKTAQLHSYLNSTSSACQLPSNAAIGRESLSLTQRLHHFSLSCAALGKSILWKLHHF